MRRVSSSWRAGYAIRGLSSLSRTRHITKRTRLPFHHKHAYEAVARVHRYPEFLPWCSNVQLVEPAVPLPDSGEQLLYAINYDVTSELDLSTLGVDPMQLDSLLHTVIRYPNNRVIATASGRRFFEELSYQWSFAQLGTHESPECMVEVEFRVVLASLLQVPAWEMASQVMIDRVSSAFTERAAMIAQDTVEPSEEPTEVAAAPSAESNPAQIPDHHLHANPLEQLLELPAAFLNQTAEVLHVPMRVQLHRDVSTPPQVQPPRSVLHSVKPGALHFVSADEVNDYADAILTSGRLQSIGFGTLGTTIELNAYSHIIKIMLIVVHESLWAIHGAEAFGYEMSLKKLSRASKRHRKFTISTEDSVDPTKLEQFVDKMTRHPKSNAKFLPNFLRQSLYKNCAILVFNLMADLTAASQIGFMGHRVRFALSPDPEPVEIAWVSHHIDSQLEERLVGMLVDEILIDRDLNFQWVPDALEREVYTVSTRFVVRIIEQIMAQMRFRVLDVDAEVALTPKKPKTRGKLLLELNQLKQQVATLEAELRTFSSK